MDRKPGRPRALTVDAIAQAALDDGIGEFSMPSVARRLGVAHSGLYRYVTDRDELLVNALDLASREARWPEADQPWRELLVAVGETVWSMCESHPGLDQAALVARRPTPTTLGHVERYVASLVDQGFLLEDAAMAVDFVISLVLSSSLTMARLRRHEEANGASRAVQGISKPFDSDEVWTGRGFYGRKLEVLLTGLDQRHLEQH